MQSLVVRCWSGLGLGQCFLQGVGLPRGIGTRQGKALARLVKLLGFDVLTAEGGGRRANRAARRLELPARAGLSASIDREEAPASFSRAETRVASFER